MGEPMPHSQVSFEEAKEMLKNYRFLRGSVRRDMDEFFSLLAEPYQSFCRYRYQQNQPMEIIAEKLGYAPRTMYVFRAKVLRWWFLFLTGEPCQ